MQSVRFVVRQIGVPNPAADVYSAQEAAEYLEYQYTSQGYVIQDTHYLGEVKGQGGETLGYKVMVVFVKNDLYKLADRVEVGTADVAPADVAPAVKRGRPAGNKNG